MFNNRYLFPSFEVEVVEHVPNKKIKLQGNNNWETLIIGHVVIIVTFSILVGVFFNPIMQTLFSRLIFAVTTLIIGGHAFDTFKRVKNKKYLKEEIEFSESGIRFTHSKISNANEIIGLDRLKKISIVVDSINYKIFLNSSETPTLDFIIFALEEEFVNEISDILNLEITESANFDGRRIYQLESLLKKPKKLKAPLNLENNELNENNKITDFKYIEIFPYKDLTLIRPKQIDHLFEISKTLRISITERLIWHRRFFILKEKFKFSEIISFEKEVKENRDYTHGTQILGNLYVQTINVKRRKIFQIRKVADKQRELVELELLKSLEQVEEEILKYKK